MEKAGEKFDKEAWRERYFETSEALEGIRLRALKKMTEAEALRQMEALTVCETPWRMRREWSGLVEQQAIFQRWRKA